MKLSIHQIAQITSGVLFVGLFSAIAWNIYWAYDNIYLPITQESDVVVRDTTYSIPTGAIETQLEDEQQQINQEYIPNTDIKNPFTAPAANQAAEETTPVVSSRLAPELGP